MTGENEKAANQRAKMAQMQQKTRDLKERNESLEIQVNLLRKRVSELEEPKQAAAVASATATERERRRLKKELDQTKSECTLLQAENLRLKAELLNNNQSTVSALHKRPISRYTTRA